MTQSLESEERQDEESHLQAEGMDDDGSHGTCNMFRCSDPECWTI